MPPTRIPVATNASESLHLGYISARLFFNLKWPASSSSSPSPPSFIAMLPSESIVPLPITTSGLPKPDKNVCAYCQKKADSGETLKRCQKCRTVPYCSREW